LPCDTRARQGQTLDQRKAEVRTAIQALVTALASGQAKALISKATGSIAFRGWPEGEQARVTDSCGYRLVMAGQSAQAKLAIARAEQLAGRTVDRAALTAGWHSHDQGTTWHKGH
jgi:hypothetical protein